MLTALVKTLFVLGCISSATACGSAKCEPLTRGSVIRFGQSAALDGPAMELGMGMQVGIRAAFAEANRDGGIKGHPLELISRDDGYDPERSIVVTRELLDDDKVLELLGWSVRRRQLPSCQLSGGKVSPSLGRLPALNSSVLPAMLM